MKHLLFVLFFISEFGLACSQTYLEGWSAEDKFLLAVEKADFVFVGKVIRLYRQPGQADLVKGYTGFVFEVQEKIKGNQSPFVDAILTPDCGINGLPWFEDDQYWPNEIGQRFVVAGNKQKIGTSVFAVWPYKEGEPLMYRVRISANKRITKG
ncbi:hypothetical protein KJY73_03315 [Bowmanella sp. Y26]|uniref:hypothetical protein n=1 Tax=Bowmanella yangjiangensis TaxID=2811230 RepID=UPI001BDD0575|nr:hypothetical protein [Bowmanella yangjiangensis]MBT1062585.1 hypothetical protein [Bowmanella yangjiangensis]